MTYLDSRFSTDDRTRHLQACWHELIVTIAQNERIFRSVGHTKEADQLFSYARTLTQHAQRHLERIVGQNGHDKDSTVVTKLIDLGRSASEDSTVNGQALADETGASQDGSHTVDVPPDVSDCVAAGPSDLEGIIQTQIDVLGDVMAKYPDEQRFEVALKMLHRARSHQRDGHPELAQRQLSAAEHVLNPVERAAE